MTARATEPFYTVNDPDRPTAVRGNQINRQTYELWDSIQPADDDDAALVHASLAADLGVTENWVEGNLDAVATLRKLPELRQLQLQLFHLDLHRLREINRALLKASEELFPEIDRLLADFLTPTRPSQELPRPYAIGQQIKAILDELDEEISTEEKSTQDCPEADTRIHEDGTGELNARYSAEVIEEIDQLIRKRAADRGLSRADALLDLIRSDAEVKVVMNVYSAKDVPDSPVYVVGVGWVDAKSARCLQERTVLVRNVDKYRDLEFDSYQAGPGLRAFLIGRDGTCRFPGCNVPATRCQVEHSVEHDRGGSTSAANCAMFCQHHHNMKTDGRFTYELDPETAEAVFTFLDGSVVSTQPEGPISPAGARWVQTVGSRREQRRKRARAEAKRQKRREEDGEEAAKERAMAAKRERARQAAERSDTIPGDREDGQHPTPGHVPDGEGVAEEDPPF